MIIILKKDPDPKQMENLKAWLVSQQLTIHESRGESHTILGLVGNQRRGYRLLPRWTSCWT
jgi:3-deoxy-7-phosphoheptulonate synthase